MKQIIQSLKTGETSLEDIPIPIVGKRQVLVKTTRSLVSIGTEKMLVEFGRSNLINKAKQQPEKVKQVLDKIYSDGLLPTLRSIRQRLDEPLPLGYCNVGRVVDIGLGVSGYSIGDRIASNGNHAEYVCVPINLTAKIPESVSDDEAVFTVMGAIALQGIRLCNPTFGETIVVIGLGLIGQITAQLLQANGCRVIGIDPDQTKCIIASEKNIITVNTSDENEPVEFVNMITDNIGTDGVIITASAKTDMIISQAARMSRKRGRIILVGVVGMKINRSEFYEKELTFQVSCSYGPGRYDEHYEQSGIDYPLPYVRWTEKRNFDAVLHALESGLVEIKPLITEKIPFSDYRKIYDNIGNTKSIASIMVYDEQNLNNENIDSDRLIKFKNGLFKESKVIVGVIGAGNFTKMTILPALKKCGANLKYIASAGGVNASHLGKKFGFSYVTTDYKTILQDANVDLVFITTRHNLHAALTVECLNAGKHVFVEKPLAINENELSEVIRVYSDVALKNGLMLNVGFNRRFSPHIVTIKKVLGDKPGPINIIATINAGFIPSNSWIHDIEIGGGRIIGEACHFIDLLVYLTGSLVTSVCVNAMGQNPEINTDNASILLKFANGSNGVINYFSNGNKSYSKERLEVYYNGRTIVMDNFRHTEAFGFKGFNRMKTGINKGHIEQFKALMTLMKNGGPALMSFKEIVNTTRVSFAALQSLKDGDWVRI